MTAALKTALREACAELRHRNADWQNDGGKWTPTEWIDAWERLADEAELIEAAQEPKTELTDEALATMLGVPVAMVAPEGARDAKPENVTRTAADIRAEMYGMPPYNGPGLKHGPCGTGRPGPCDAGCRKCMLRAAELVAMREEQKREPAGFDRLQASLVAPVSLRLFASGHAALCCARLGNVWCTEPDGHAGECKGPEEREIANNDFGPRRKR